jgi:hypothetical protein
MGKHQMSGKANPGLDARHRFGGAWVAAFMGVVLIIGAVLWAANVVP